MGRDTKWKEETIANTSEEQFRQSWNVSFLVLLVHSWPTKQRTLAHVAQKKWQEVGYTKSFKQGAIYNAVSRGVGLDYSAFVVGDITKCYKWWLNLSKLYRFL